jgi:hypothetical protein
LTKLLKEHGKEKVMDAALKTLKNEAVEPKEYMLGVLKNGDAGEVWKQSDEALLLMAKERGINTRGKTRQDLINALR